MNITATEGGVIGATLILLYWVLRWIFELLKARDKGDTDTQKTLNQIAVMSLEKLDGTIERNTRVIEAFEARADAWQTDTKRSFVEVNTLLVGLGGKIDGVVGRVDILERAVLPASPNGDEQSEALTVSTQVTISE